MTTLSKKYIGSYSAKLFENLEFNLSIYWFNYRPHIISLSPNCTFLGICYSKNLRHFYYLYTWVIYILYCQIV